MANAYTMEDVLDFLTYASERGLMPAATATALGVAVRNVLGVLDEDERRDLGGQDMDAVVKRFTNKRARDFNPTSLKEYGRRVRRALDLYESWRSDPANFSIKTRATNAGGKKQRNGVAGASSRLTADPSQPELREPVPAPLPPPGGGYTSAIPIRADWVVTVANVPVDLTAAEAERLAKFVRMLAVE